MVRLVSMKDVVPQRVRLLESLETKQDTMGDKKGDVTLEERGFIKALISESCFDC